MKDAFASSFDDHPNRHVVNNGKISIGIGNEEMEKPP